MSHPTDHEWRNRVAPAEESDVATTRRTDGRDDSVPVEGSAPTDGVAGHRCPVCEFASGEFDDVDAHLTTGHRKSTTSAALLRT